MHWLVTADDTHEIVCRYLKITGVYSDDPEERIYISKKIRALESLLSVLDAFHITTDA